jgi:flagellar protein FlaJ
LEGFIAIVRTGGDLKGYLLSYGKALLGSKEIAVKELSDTLASMAEAYVTLLVVFPLLMIIMFSVMSIVSGSIAGIRVDLLMSLVTYIFIPLLGLMMIIMLDAVMPKGE